MSRLIIKNLPGKITQDKLRTLFGEHGTITDVKLSYTKDGKFRRFAFIGFKELNQAENARNHFHNSLILNQKVLVEICNDFMHGKHSVPSHEGDKVKITDAVTEGEKKEKAEAKVISDADFLKIKKQNEEGNKDDHTKLSSKTVDQTLGTDGSQTQFLIRVRNAPPKLTEKKISEFFYPLVPTSTKILKGKARSGALVGFASEKDITKALQLSGDCIEGKSLKLKRVSQSDDNDAQGRKTWQEKIDNDRNKIDVDEVADSGRLFVRNLSYLCTEEDLEKLFGSIGTLSEVHIPIDTMTRKNIGIGFVTFMFPEHAIKALNEIDGTAFQGRMIHLLPAKIKPEHAQSEKSSGASSYKKQKAQADKSTSQQTYNWNTLFIGTDAVAGAIAEKYNISKADFLETDDKESTAVRVALGETQIVQETRQFLVDSGISLDAFSQPDAERSKSVILAKNLPAGATAAELRNMFEPHGELGRVLLAPAGVTAVIEFLEPSHARQAFMKQAYRKFHHKPLYLEWAPVDVFANSYADFKAEQEKEKTEEENLETLDENENDMEEGTTLFVKNLNFVTTEEDMTNHFSKCGKIYSCTISKKKSHKKDELLSMGYGFVQYYRKADTGKALKLLQKTFLDGHQLELKMSNHMTKTTANLRKKQLDKKQTSAKILVRNIPFQADTKEITSLFKTFGELKSVRLPKKLSVTAQSGTHRGFAFVDYVTKQDAKKAFQALCHSTHLYGRRLVLEWADSEEDSLIGLRRKTAEHFHGSNKKFKSRDDFEKSLSNRSETT